MYILNIISYINWVDIIVLVFILRCVYLGTATGLTAESFKFIGTVLSLVLAVHWHSQVAGIITTNLSLPAWLSQFLCFVIINQTIRIIFKYGVVMLLKVLNLQFLPKLERGGGAIIGFGRSIILAGIVLLSLLFIPSDYMQESICQKSFSGRFMIKTAERAYLGLTFWLPPDRVQRNIFFLPGIRKEVEKV